MEKITYIPVVFCFDSNYSNHAATAIFSLFLNSRVPVKIYCIVPASDTKAIPAIHQIKDKFRIDISVISAENEVFSTWKEVGNIARATYLRLLIPNLIKEAKVIYLDADVIVLSDLSELYATPVDNIYIAGVVDPDGSKASKVPREKNDVYINAGVLVMNLDGLRSDNFFQHCQEIYSAYEEKITWCDQCVINKYAENRKTIIDPKWNRQIFSNNIKRNEWDDLISNSTSSIIHFVGGEKPWMEWCNPCISEFWWGYAKKLNIEKFEPVKASSIKQLISFANVLDINEDHKRSGLIKNHIINTLLQQSRQ